MDKVTNSANGLDFLDQLRENNQNNGRTFDDLSQFLEQRARENGVPIHGQFELTPLCNFDCKMCYAHLTKEQVAGRNLLTTEQWKDLMRQAYDLGMYQATLTGGECLTYPGFEELYLYLHSLGCEINVLTNGYLLDDRWVEFFKQHMPAKIQITLYGHDENSYERVTGHRSFGRVRHNIERIKESGLPLILTVTPSVYLGKAVLETIRTAKNLCDAVQVSSSLFIPRKETGRADHEDEIESDLYIQIYRLMNEMEGRESKEVPEELLPEVGGPFHECTERGILCGGGRSGFVIDWKGRMIPCNQLEQIESYPLRDGVREAWNHINLVVNNWPRVPECRGCPYYNACDTCPAVMARFEQPGKQPLALCRKTKYMVRNGIRRIPACDY